MTNREFVHTDGMHRFARIAEYIPGGVAALGGVFYIESLGREVREKHRAVWKEAAPDYPLPTTEWMVMTTAAISGAAHTNQMANYAIACIRARAAGGVSTPIPRAFFANLAWTCACAALVYYEARQVRQMETIWDKWTVAPQGREKK